MTLQEMLDAEAAIIADLEARNIDHDHSTVAAIARERHGISEQEWSETLGAHYDGQNSGLWALPEGDPDEGQPWAIDDGTPWGAIIEADQTA